METMANQMPAGNTDIEDAMDVLGYGKMRLQIDDLKDMIQVLDKDLVDEPRGFAGDVLDPDTTIFVTDPPTPFASKAMMKAFLNYRDNAAIAEKHHAWVAARDAAAGPKIEEVTANG